MKESLRLNLHEAESQIHSTFDSLVRSLVERRDRLLREAAEAHVEKQLTLKKQRDALEGKLARMLSCAELTVSPFHFRVLYLPLHFPDHLQILLFLELSS